MSPRWRQLAVALSGLTFGFALARAGFTDWGELNRMFTLQSPRLFLTFGMAVAVIGLGMLVLGRAAPPSRRWVHRGTVPGAILFGVGWALTGACPSAVVVQLGELKPLALLTLLGVLVGGVGYGKVHARFFGWARDSCDS